MDDCRAVRVKQCFHPTLFPAWCRTTAAGPYLVGMEDTCGPPIVCDGVRKRSLGSEIFGRLGHFRGSEKTTLFWGVTLWPIPCHGPRDISDSNERFRTILGGDGGHMWTSDRVRWGPETFIGFRDIGPAMSFLTGRMTLFLGHFWTRPTTGPGRYLGLQCLFRGAAWWLEGTHMVVKSCTIRSGKKHWVPRYSSGSDIFGVQK